MSGENADPNLYIRDALGAYKALNQLKFAIYIPDKDSEGQTIEAQTWVRRTLLFLDDLNGGATALPAALGIWHGAEENTVIVYSHMTMQIFDQHKFAIRAFLHRFGREASQGEVLCEFGATALFISQYDPGEGEES